MTLYYIGECRCGNVQSGMVIKENNLTKAIFLCRKCQKSTKIFDKTNRCYRVKVLKVSENASFIQKLCAKVREKKQTKQNDKIKQEIGFESY